MRHQISADELASLYHDIGACIWHMQYLEDALHTLITLKVEIKKPGGASPQEAMNLLAKHRRSTLGTALKTAETNEALPQPLMDQLRGLKEERDWLVHRSMHQGGAHLYTDDGRKVIFARLSAIQSNIGQLKGEIINEISTFCSGHGISPAQATA
jgi:hypothetical protein